MDTELTQFQKAHQMEVILGLDSEPFETFLSDQMTTSSGEKDSETESMFNMIKQMDPDSFALKLANYLTCPYHDLYYREECAELLRKFLTDDDDLCTWRYLSVCTQSSIKRMILDHMKLEESKFIIQELRRTVSKLAASLFPDNNWPELLPFLYQCITNSSLNNNLKRSAFLIVGQLADDIGETTVPCVNDLRPLLLITLNDDTLPLDLRIFATRVVIRMMRRLTEKEQFHNLLPVMMRTLTDALTISEEAKDALVECAEILRKLLANDEKVLEERMRQLVVEFLTLFHKAQMEAILWPGSSVPFKTFISDHIESSKEKDAEAVWMFNMMKRMHPDSLALKLADYLTHPSRDICTREKCAKLFCKLLTDDDDLCTWHNLSSSTQSRIKCILLDCISLEESEFIIYQLRVTTSKLAASLLPDNKWPELFPSLYQCVTSCSSNNYFKESVFLIFAHLTECIGETIVPWAKTLHSLFLNTLNDDTLDLNVRMAAVRAVIRTMKTLTKKEQFQDLLPGMMRTLTDALTVGTEAAKYALEESAELLHKVLTDDEKALEERMRQLVVEFLTQFHKAQVEAILGPDSEPFQMFISDHWSSSEEKISEVKWMFNMMKYKDPNSFAIKLADYLGPSHHLYMRQECAELLYKLLTGDDDLCTWHNLSVTTQSTIKCMILDHMKLEESEFIIEVLCNTICKLAASLLLDNNWPELLPFMYQCISSASSNNKLKQSAFLIFALLAKDIGEIIVPCVKTLTSLFLNTLNDDSLNLNVRIAATAAVLSFIQCVSSSNEKERFQVLLPGVMTTLTDALSNSEEEDAAQDVLGLFIELAKNEPKFLRRQLAVVVGAKLEIAETKSSEDRTRHLAVIFLLTLVEAKDKVPGMMKKLPLFTNTCFVILLNFLLDIKDEPSWHSAEIKHKDARQTDNYIFGKNCLDRFSIALGGKTVVPIAIEQLSAYLVAPEWEKRHAALIALAQIAEGSSKVMIKYLEQVVNMVLHSIQDSHPRVRCAAILAIDRFTLDFCPVFQEQYHNQVLPALAAAMDDFQNPQLQAHAAIAVASFCESKKPETLVPHLHELLKKLVVLLQNDNQTVQGAALEAVSRIADLSKEHFQKYYNFVMPYLKTILVNANDNNDMLQSIALECMSFVGKAEGKEKFRDDSKQVIEVLKSLQKSLVKELDAIVCNLRTWFRICECMGKDFLPYMSTVMLQLVECAQIELDKTVLSYDSIHKLKFGDGIICARGRDLLGGKSMACAILGAFAETLKEDFYPWIFQATSILVPLLKFYIHNDVRRSATMALAPLLHSAKLAVEEGTAQGGNESYFKQLSGDIVLAIGDALCSEPETKICAILLHELDSCLEICGPLLNENQVLSIINEIKHVLTESSRRKGELTERAKSEDFDAEEAELLREEREQEVEIFKYVGYILLTLIKTFKADFLLSFDELSSYLMPMRGKDNTAEERHMCICIFDGLVEHYGEAALKYCNTYLPFLLDTCNDDSPDVRQAALYGLGLCAEYGGYAFKPSIGVALSRINVVITHLDALEPENLLAYDNSVSALGKICQFHRESIDSAQIIPAWLNCLPIRVDMDEAKLVHAQLCSMVERSDRELLGLNYLHLPKVISVFVEVLCCGENLATDETTKRMINLLRHFQQTVPAATLASACSLLLPQQEMELESILSPEERC